MPTPATIWTLTTVTEGDDQPSTTVHLTEAHALATLRDSWEVPAWVADDDLIAELLGDPVAGFVYIELEEHDLPTG
ncbi:hypothetical protein SEA_TYPHA_46 [Mycobacterium phage Typha]|uniref:Uncharacterized protein n=1 Tax=Mycobacterium phage Typha TaxID=2517971 RepID=A0A482JCK3_9CAUD|nr:hypothetical protein KCH40_gp123 [Mycobacterium phage Typha]QBP29701.1 hypothetical protein SEA_TYPHA_46 [Mycobacterium phage Typha]